MGITYDNWKKFFFSSDEGQGTLYDRLVLHSFFDRFINDYEIKNVLDCPSFGMTGFSGINSLYLAKRGLPVTVVDDDEERLLWVKQLWKKIDVKVKPSFVMIDDWSDLPFDDKSFDLVWNLSSLWHLNNEDVYGLLRELGRIYNRVFFSSVHNTNQIVFPIYKRVDPEFFKKVNEELCKEHYLTLLFNKHFGPNYFLEKGYFVTTPWPGITIKKQDIFGESKFNSNNNFCLSESDIDDCIKVPDYYECLKNDECVTKIGSLEKLPNSLKKYWSHLTYYIYYRG